MPNDITINKTPNQLALDAARWQEISEQVERLEEERDEAAQDLERAARKIGSAAHRFGRTTEHPHFRGLTADGRAAFDIIDGYENEYTGELVYSLAELADPEGAIARVSKERHRQTIEAARAGAACAQQRLEKLERSEKLEEEA